MSCKRVIKISDDGTMKSICQLILIKTLDNLLNFKTSKLVFVGVMFDF